MVLVPLLRKPEEIKAEVKICSLVSYFVLVSSSFLSN